MVDEGPVTVYLSVGSRTFQLQIQRDTRVYVVLASTLTTVWGFAEPTFHSVRAASAKLATVSRVKYCPSPR
jgi:hypothetical protein